MGLLDVFKRQPLPDAAVSGRGTGARLRSWRPELPDQRDHIYRLAAGDTMPNEVAPLGAKTRIHDQGMTSSCTGHAATAMLETRLGLTGDSGQLSRLFPYTLARMIIGEVHLDGGAYNRDVVKSMVNHGVPLETNWRFNASNMFRLPSDKAYHYAELMRQKIEAQKFVYERVTSLESLLDAIATGNPVMFGFLAFDHFYDLTSKQYVFNLPLPNQQPIGGHAVMADGYSMSDRTVWVQNSWGTGWGKRGYFKMPFDWWLDPGRLVDDMWTLRPTA